MSERAGLGVIAMNEAEEFMDKWLDENVRPAHLKRPETLVAKVWQSAALPTRELPV